MTQIKKEVTALQTLLDERARLLQNYLKLKTNFKKAINKDISSETTLYFDKAFELGSKMSQLIIRIQLAEATIQKKEWNKNANKT